MAVKDFDVVCFLLAGVLWTVRGITLTDRSLCGKGDVTPPSRVNTTGRLKDFRESMAKMKISAMIIGSTDAHNSEYAAEYDQIRSYISGFDGSMGTAVVTQDEAVLWIDGRYHSEAEEYVDCNWILMKTGLPGTPSIEEWINSKMSSPGQYVGVDPSLITHSGFIRRKEMLASLSKKAVLKEVASTDPNNPAKTWADRPPRRREPVNVLPIRFAGKTWQEKIVDLRQELSRKSAVAYVVTSLDETAWLFNLRGSDVPFLPLFMSYAIVEARRTRLYILNKDERLVQKPTDPESNQTLSEHLATSKEGKCTKTGSDPCVEVMDYDELLDNLKALANTGKVWISYQASYAVSSAVSANRLIDKSPIALPKSKKNAVERAGMINSHNRDSAALIKFLAFLEREIADGKEWTELTAAEELNRRRWNVTYSRGPSFETISGYGPNGAAPHYKPKNRTAKVLGTDNLYVLDSGGQYLDGTTDVTRTMHYGNSTDYHKECYTLVLASTINLAMLKWPEGLYGNQIDAITRHELWEAGFVYRHGTGHGIGAYLGIHEGPACIGMASSIRKTYEPVSEHQFMSDEPGYYEDNSFGVRVETIMQVVSYTPPHNTSGVKFLAFKPVTLVPFEHKLIDYSRMSHKQIEWLNDYNSKVRAAILPLLEGDELAIDWMKSRMEAVTLHTAPVSPSQGAEAIQFSTTTFLISTIYIIFVALNE